MYVKEGFTFLLDVTLIFNEVAMRYFEMPNILQVISFFFSSSL